MNNQWCRVGVPKVRYTLTTIGYAGAARCVTNAAVLAP